MKLLFTTAFLCCFLRRHGSCQDPLLASPGEASRARLQKADSVVLLFLILFLITSAASADSVSYQSSGEMIETADYVAIVEFQRAERGEFRGAASYPAQKERTSRQFFRRVTARVVKNLKGSLPEEIQIYDRSGWWDSLFQNHQDRSKSDSGRYLIFLSGDGSFLTGANGWVSTARIEGEKLEWSESPSASDIRMVTLDDVLNRVKKQDDQN